MKSKDPHIIQLEKCIRLTASKSEQYKTILVTGPHFYIPVTRVNYITCLLWWDHIKPKIKGRKDIELPNKINWLIMMSYYRRKIEQKLNSKPNVESEK